VIELRNNGRQGEKESNGISDRSFIWGGREYGMLPGLALSYF
jgi:hypothetical protein